ncbi:MAG: carboxypeptidase-like regulatory domain-containing protein, partial [Candidatus Zixiibacteriota bacterium]
AEGSAVAGAEVFFDEVWSDGTGIPLRPVGAEWGIAPRAAGERYVLDLHGRGVRKKGPHVLYVHGKDGAGNWGEFYEVPFDVTGPPRPSRDIAGRVSFEKLPAPGALVTARPEGDRRAPVAITVSDEKGLFTLEKLPPGRYDVNALLDEDEDGRWRRGEPEGVAAGVVDVAASDATGVDIVLTYGPSLSSANARIQSFAGDRAVLALSAAARDRDMDLARVWAELPGGIEVDLADDGIPPDDAAGDGIYKYAREYRGEEFAARPEGDVVIYAEDGRGNRVTATVSESPGLRLARVDAPSGLELYTGAEGLDVSWTPVENAWGGYVVFLVPADRLDRFTGPGTGEVYSNFRNPSYGTALTIPYDAVEDWWAYPAGSKFTVFVIASAGDADNYQASDKAIITAEWRKPATR